MLFPLTAAAPARANDVACPSVTLVFARGSGQPLGGRESTAFFAGLAKRLGTSVRTDEYELGTGTYGGAHYPAIGIGLDSSDSFENLLAAAAFWSSSESNRYRVSVAAGTTELRAYLQQKLDACPGERFVLGGFSQGAQVMGDALPKLSAALRSQIAFMTLFGDPKLYLPEGKGIFPTACQGKHLSPWRRGNVSCYTDNGILEARKPYLPADMQNRVGSWCDRDDPICNDNFADFLHSTHGRYADTGGDVDQAVREAAIAVQKVLGDQGQSIEVAPARSDPPPRTLPSARLAIDEYWAHPGDTVHLDAARSTDQSAQITSYGWDFDGNGVVDETTTAPTTDHAYPSAFEGTAKVRLTAADGGTASAAAPVHVNSTGLAPRLPAAPTQVSVRATTLHWKSGAKAGKVETWRVHDSDGRLLAQLPGNARQVRLASVPDPAAKLTVEAVNAYGTSNALTVRLPRTVKRVRPVALPAGAGGSAPRRVPLRAAAAANAFSPVPAAPAPRGGRLFALEVTAAVLLAAVALSWLLAARRRRASSAPLNH